MCGINKNRRKRLHSSKLERLCKLSKSENLFLIFRNAANLIKKEHINTY